MGLVKGDSKMKIFQVDSFTDRPFKGNPAGVCLLEKEQADAWMQNIAMEMNLSETAFLLKNQGRFNLRWFTPKTEVQLCGHATLASAHILWEERILDGKEPAKFYTKSGELACEKVGNWIEMTFPSRQVRAAETSRSLIDALRLSGKEKKFYKYDGNGEILYLVEVAYDKIVKELTPDFEKLKTEDAKAVIVTAKSSSKGFDFISRFFAPSLGVDEDPVTGAAHCYLAPYWSKVLDKSELTGYQTSRRGGVVKCELRGEKVIIKGQAVTIFKGELVNC